MIIKLEEFVCVVNDVICDYNDNDECCGCKWMGIILVMVFVYFY